MGIKQGLFGPSSRFIARVPRASAMPKQRMHSGPRVFLLLVIFAAFWLSGFCARAADGELISPNGVPKTGSFYRMQRQTPPLPFNPFPDLPVYAVDWYRNIFLIDDRSVDYDQLEEERKALAEGAEEGG